MEMARIRSMKYRTIFVAATPGRYEKEGLLGGSTEKESECWIDGDRLARDCEKACNDLGELGFEVISITEITRGSYHLAQSGAGWGLNHGILVTARRSG